MDEHQGVTPRRAAATALLVAVLAVVASVVALSAGRSPSVLSAASGGAPGVLPAAQARPAPELVGVKDFDGTAPLTLAGLRGRVVLVDFWTYTCINCRRTFPFLRALSSTYAPAGLTVLGVHSPEFGFERSHANVARAVRELGVTWPVAEDPDMATWSAFGNQYWPADYLLDRQGRVRYLHVGEGGDGEVENAVRTLLAEGGSAPGARIGDVVAQGQPGDASSGLTAETYFGGRRGADFLAGGRAIDDGSTVVRHDGPQRDGLLRLEGRITGGADSLELGAGAWVQQRLHARDVYATAAPAEAPVVLDVTLDGRPVPIGRRGASLRVEGGRTVVTVANDDLLHLLTGPAVADGVLRLTARTAGARLFTFTYGA